MMKGQRAAPALMLELYTQLVVMWTAQATFLGPRERVLMYE
jgi:hypothetical protein